MKIRLFSVRFIDLGLGGCNSKKNIRLFFIIEIIIQYMNIGGGGGTIFYIDFMGGNQYKNASSLSLVWPQFCQFGLCKHSTDLAYNAK